MQLNKLAALALSLGSLLSAQLWAQEGNHAVVVSDQYTISVHLNGSDTVDRVEVIKALDSMGASELRRFTIPYQADRADVTVLSASVVADAADAPRRPGWVEDVVAPAAANAPAYAGARLKAVSFADLAPLDTVRLHYRVVRRLPMFPSMYSFFAIDPRSWPIQSLRFKVTAPTALNLQVDAQQMVGRRVDINGTSIWSYSASLVPAIFNVASQSEMLGKSPYLAINSATATLNSLGQSYRRRVQPPQKMTLELQYLADHISENSIHPETMMEKFYGYINTHVRLVDLPLNLNLSRPRTAENILLSGYGTAEDRAIVMQALMKAKDQNTDFVLMPSLPVYWTSQAAGMPDFYGRVLVTTGAMPRPLDLSNTVLSIGQFDPQDRGKVGLRVSERGQVESFRIPVSPVSQSMNTVSSSIIFQEDGSADGSAIVSDYGDFAAIDRDLVLHHLDSVSRVIASHGPAGGTWQTTSASDPLKPSNKFVFRGRYHIANYTPVGKGYKSMVPRIATSLSSMDAVIGKQGKGLCVRTWRNEHTVLAWAGHHIASLPRDVWVTLPGGIGSYEATYRYRPDGTTAEIDRTLRVDVDPLACSQAQQHELATMAAAARDDLKAMMRVN